MFILFLTFKFSKMKKKIFSVLAAAFMLFGLGYSSFATMDTGCYYKDKNCLAFGKSKCSGSGSDCGLETDCA